MYTAEFACSLVFHSKNVIDRGVPQLQAGAKPLSYEASDMWLFSWYLTILVRFCSLLSALR